MTAVVVDGPDGKEYRLPTEDEIRLAAEAASEVDRVFAEIPFGIPDEPLPSKEALGFRVPLYGFDRWYKLFTSRQLLSLGAFVKNTRTIPNNLLTDGYESDWVDAIVASLAVCVDRLADRNSELAWWQTTAQKVGPTFTRWALPMTWDHVEICPWADLSGSYPQAVDWVAEVFEHLASRFFAGTLAKAEKSSAIQPRTQSYDVVVTDPPYYDAIPYSDLMDFYYVWLRRSLHGISEEISSAFREALGPKWDSRAGDGELIDDSSRFDGNKIASKNAYENGMFRAFQECDRALVTDGRMVVVFANKSPNAWETLVSAMIRAGFVVDGSWPIQTERVGRIRSVASAALSSSVWLVCRKRSEAARPGWDNIVLDQMRENIYSRLREYWDAGIRGPDFVWAATGPALEAYSKHPVVRKANEPGKILEVSEFLRAVRRIVVDFVVGRVLSHNGDEGAASGLDDVTTYYLLHRHDFGLNEAPIGACILYAISCGLSDHDLVDRFDILQKSGGAVREAEEDEEEEGNEAEEEEATEASGSAVKLRPWNRRTGKNLGYDGDARPAPLIDQVHRLMHLWRAGDQVKVDDYLDARGLRRSAVFHQLLQALIELASERSEERTLLEVLSNHIRARGVAPEEPQSDLPFGAEGGDE